MDKIGWLKEEAKRILKEKIFAKGRIVSLPSGEKKREKISKYLEDILDKLLREQRIDLPQDSLENLKSQILAEALGYGSLEELIKDPSITDILVNSPSQVFIEKKGEISRLNIRFNGPEEIKAIIERMMIGSSRRIDQFSPFVDFRLEDGSRVTAIIPPVSSSPSLCIRKFSKEVFYPQDLLKLGTLTEKTLNFLELAVRARLNILITGSTGVGKTTLLNALIRFVPNNQRIVVIEDTEELSIPQTHHFLKLLSRPANIEGKGEITLYDLVKLSLHLRPDRIVIGEVRGEEAFYFLQAINTGHEGSLCTLHANDALDALARLETLGLMAKPNIQAKVVKRFLSMGIDLIVHLRRTQKGKRVISQISEVIYQDENYLVKDIFLLSQRFEDNRESWKEEFTGYIPSFIDKLKIRTGKGEEFFK